MESSDAANETIRTIGLTQFKVAADGATYKRRVGTQEWRLADNTTTTTQATASAAAQAAASDGDNKHAEDQSAPIDLSLVRMDQAPGEPLHWLLYLAPENGAGRAMQVTGDAQLMRYVATAPPPTPAENVCATDSFHDAFILATALTPAQQQRVEAVAAAEAPPRAATRRDVTENCQGWAVRVVAKLADEGIVRREKVPQLTALLEPVRNW
jgi:hypothetical protein